VVHVGLGGRRILAPVLAQTDLSKREKARFHYLWHIATILILGIAAAYAYALATACASWRSSPPAWRWPRRADAAVRLPRGYSLRVYPQWALFAPSRCSASLA